MTSLTSSSEPGEAVAEPAAVRREAVAESDTIPRIQVRDLMSAVQFLNRTQGVTLDALRIKLNTDRKKRFGGGTAGYSVARDVASELGSLGYAIVGPLPKDAKGFEKKRDAVIRLKDDGLALAETLRADKAEAYATVLKAFYRGHLYMRRYVAAVMAGPFLAPVVTSVKEHISPKYGSGQALADDVALGKFEISSLLEITSTRLQRSLDAEEQAEIEKEVGALVERLRTAAAREPQTDFGRKFQMALNEIVVPAVLRSRGLGFDYNSLRRLWLMGREFQISWATSAHPRYQGWLTFETANFELGQDGSTLDRVRFNNGLKKMSEAFLDRLYAAYSLMQEWGWPSVVTAWELRATFCHQHRCAPGVFDHLFRENYGGSDVYRIDKDFPRNKPGHEDPLIVGGREIGLIRISKR